MGPRSAGDLLRQQRRRLASISADVAAALKIKPGYLAALEAGRPDLLPGPAYAIGFVRAYGDYLGLDGERNLAPLQSGVRPARRKARSSFPIPLGDRSIPGGAMLLVALILALCGYGTWYYVSTSERSRPERVSKCRPSSQRCLSARENGEAVRRAGCRAVAGWPPSATTPDASGAGFDRFRACPKRRAAALSASATSSAFCHGLAVGAAAAVYATPQAEGPHFYGAIDGTARIVIRATSDSWIQIRSTDQTTGSSLEY